MCLKLREKLERALTQRRENSALTVTTWSDHVHILSRLDDNVKHRKGKKERYQPWLGVVQWVFCKTQKGGKFETEGKAVSMETADVVGDTSSHIPWNNGVVAVFILTSRSNNIDRGGGEWHCC